MVTIESIIEKIVANCRMLYQNFISFIKEKCLLHVQGIMDSCYNLCRVLGSGCKFTTLHEACVFMSIYNCLCANMHARSCLYCLFHFVIQDDSSDSEAEFEQLKKAAQIKYANFRQEFSLILDPNDDVELKQMEEMGLPVMFINSRTDVSFH